MKKTANMHVRFASFFLALIMLLSAGAVLASAEVTGVTYVEAYSKNWGGIVSNLPCDAEDDVLAERIFINGQFKSLQVSIATYATTETTVLAQVIKWNKNYDLTMSSTPIYEERLGPLKDNSWIEIDIGTTCEAGEYLIVFKEAKGKLPDSKYGYFTTYARSMNKVGLGCMYINGVEQMYDMYMKVGFVGEAPAEPFKAAITFQDVTTSSLGANTTSDYYRFGPAIDVIGQRLNVSAPIIGFALGTANWGNQNCAVDIAVFKWDKDYETTIAAEPLYKETYKNFNDNASLWIMFDDPLPAGEYLFAAMNGWTGTTKSLCAVYCRDTNHSKGYAYVNGAELRNDLSFTIRFENSLGGKAAFLDCNGADDASTGTATVPEQWKPAEDSLINTHKVQPTTWVFTDGLGRESWEYGENGVGAFNSEKVLGIFYWNWQLRSGDSTTAFNIQEFIQQYPEAKNDYYHFGWNLNGKLCYWNEPLYGYYTVDDPWVLRRHAELLANANIDTVFTDNTNSTYTFIDSYHNIFEQWTAAQNDGVNTPKLTWYFPIWWQADGNEHEDIYSTEQMESVYLDVFKRGIYQNMWFWFDGKPVFNGNSMWFEQSSEPLHKEILSFFTFRKGVSSYKDQEDRTDDERMGDWGWLSKYPQATYAGDKTDLRKGQAEQMSVGIAQNHNFKTNELDAMNGPFTMGRSYSSTNQTRYHKSQKKEVSETSKWGYNFEEQWNYALEVDPTVVYITGWNEWTVGRSTSWCGTSNAFADQFNDEYSRDIEPTKGALKDYYYYQLINYTRKFKGADEMPVPTAKATIDLSKGLEAQWEGVGPYFAAYIGNVMNRDSYGRVGATPYRDFSARNDVIGAQIARDDEYVYFNVECNEDITPYTYKLWMNLYIDVDQTNKGWETFDYVVNKTAASAKTSVLEKFTGEGYTSEKVADVEYKVDGKFMTIKIAKSDLGLKGDDYTINFAWTDNVHDSDDKGAITKNGWVYTDFSGDIMDFYLSGEVAPGARFKFSYISTADNAAGLPVVDPETSTPAETTKPIEPTTTAPTTTPADTETSEPATTPAGTETPAPATTTAAPATTTTVSPTETTTAAPEVTTEADKGCGSVVGSAAAVAVIAMAGAAAVVLKKKKEDEK